MSKNNNEIENMFVDSIDMKAVEKLDSKKMKKLLSILDKINY
tara:strand:+ start:2954 stop:3079 length:126 start_codon:yes stop_codon:yes gene_type:complete